MSLQPQPASSVPVAAVSARGPESVEVQSQQEAMVLAGVARGALKGKNIGLLCDDPVQPEALLAYRAALELGAHVSLVRPRFEELDDIEAMQETARMLGRLYDAVACVAIPCAVTAELIALAGVPVITEPVVESAPAASMAGRAAATGSDADCVGDRHWLWQAALISSFASM